MLKSFSQEEKKYLNFIVFWRQPDWGFYNRRNEAFTKHLAVNEKVNQVVHVEWLPLRGLLRMLYNYLYCKDKDLKALYLLHIKKALSLKVVKVNDKLGLYTILVVSNRSYNDYPGVNLLSKLQLFCLNQQLKLIQGPKIMLAYPPNQYLEAIIDTVEHDLLFVDLVDDLETVHTEINGRSVEKMYATVLSKCKKGYATADMLAKRYAQKFSCDIQYLANGVDSIDNSQDPQAENIAKTPVVGYFGILNREVDISIIEYLVNDNPEIDFHFIGKIEPTIGPIFLELVKNKKNVIYYGQIAHKNLGKYVSNFDVMANYKKADITTAGNDSIKIYEYLATGKPIVSTSIAPATRFSDVIYVSDDKAEFSACIKLAVREKTPEKIAKRKKLAGDNTWSKRVEIILNDVLNVL
ncbi:hypothetical protein [Methylomonas sp. AM2-LC]|uniref:hypothetical protein n=1 Tax=Methylomonas sp. AM2-LC TaxID=3153301 RepID=UPI003265C176